MKHSNSSLSAATAKPPYAPAETLAEVPFVFYEILQLATEGKSEEIIPLIKSVIRVTQIDPEGLINLPHVADQEATA